MNESDRRRLTRGLAFVLTAIAIASGAARAAPVTLSVPNVEAQAGGQAEVSIAVKGAKGLRAFQLVFTYDPAVLEVVKDADAEKVFSRGKVVPENSLLSVYTTSIPPAVGPDGKPSGEATPVKPGRIPVFFLGAGDESKKSISSVDEDGTLVTIRFRVVGTAGQKTALTLEKAEAFHADGLNLLVKTEPGELTVSSAFSWWWLLIPIGLLLILALWWGTRSRSSASTPAGHATAQPAISPAAAAMQHTCLQCRQTFTVPPESVGKKFFCPACGAPQGEG